MLALHLQGISSQEISNLGGMTRLAVQDGKEIKKRTKELMTSLINGALQRKQLIFLSDDLEVEDQFITHTLRDFHQFKNKSDFALSRSCSFHDGVL